MFLFEFEFGLFLFLIVLLHDRVVVLPSFSLYRFSTALLFFFRFFLFASVRRTRQALAGSGSLSLGWGVIFFLKAQKMDIGS